MMEQEYSWVKYIHQRIENNKNFILIISGPTGSGKTWAGLSLGEMLDEEFKINRVVFKGTELMKLINSGELKTGSVILWDEAGIDLSSRAWQSMMNKMLNFLLQTFRHKNVVLIMTAPYGDFIDVASRKLFHAEFETVSINQTKKTCTLKPKLLQYNASNQKWYRKYLRVIKEGLGTIRIQRWAIPKPSNDLIDVYEKKKTDFTYQLNNTIEKSLKKIDGGDEDRLTDRQREILSFWKKGEFHQGIIGEYLSMKSPQLSDNIKWMKNKGFDREEYKNHYKNKDSSSSSTQNYTNNLNLEDSTTKVTKDGHKSVTPNTGEET